MTIDRKLLQWIGSDVIFFMWDFQLSHNSKIDQGKMHEMPMCGPRAFAILFAYIKNTYVADLQVIKNNLTLWYSYLQAFYNGFINFRKGFPDNYKL